MAGNEAGEKKATAAVKVAKEIQNKAIETAKAEKAKLKALQGDADGAKMNAKSAAAKSAAELEAMKQQLEKAAIEKAGIRAKEAESKVTAQKAIEEKDAAKKDWQRLGMLKAQLAAKETSTKEAAKRASFFSGTGVGKTNEGWFTDHTDEGKEDKKSPRTLDEVASRAEKKATAAAAAAKRAIKLAAVTMQKAELARAMAQEEMKTTKNSWGCMVAASKLPVCEKDSSLKIGPLGMASGRIIDCAIKGTSSTDQCPAHIGGRLLPKVHLNKAKGCNNVWHPHDDDSNAAMTIDIGYIAKITAIAIKGVSGAKEPTGVYQFRVASSPDGEHFSVMKGNLGRHPIEIMNGDVPGVTCCGTANRHEMPIPIVTRYLQIIVSTHATKPQFAVEIYGTNECQYLTPVMPIGVDYSVPRTAFKIKNGQQVQEANTVGMFAWDDGMRPSLMGGYPLQAFPQQYYQMETARSWEFRFVSSQMQAHSMFNGKNTDNAVHTYTIRYSNEARMPGSSNPPELSFVPYKEGDAEVVFHGNDCRKTPTPTGIKGGRPCGSKDKPYSDKNMHHKYGIVTNEFTPSFTAKTVRLLPVSWGRVPTITLEYYVSASAFNWRQVKDAAMSDVSCPSLFSATESAWVDWSQGLNGDNLVWRSAPRSIGENTFTAYRKSAVRSNMCGSLTKEMLCYTNIGGGDEKCCVRKTSDAICDEWNDQSKETKTF